MIRAPNLYVCGIIGEDDMKTKKTSGHEVKKKVHGTTKTTEAGLVSMLI